MALKTRKDHERLLKKVQARKEKREQDRIKRPEAFLFDGDYRLRGQLVGWRALKYEFKENETGTAVVKLSLSHHKAKWLMAFQGRAKRNVHLVINKQGTRWNGFMDHYTVVRTPGGDAYLEIVFKHDFEQAKFIYCWANPFLRPEVQFPKVWVIFGPAKWCLLMTLFVNIMRLETSLWTLPDNPLDINEWMGGSFNPGNWRNIVKPFPLLGDNSNTTIVFSRFKSWFDVAKKILQDSQLTVVCRRYLPMFDDPHPFADLQGELDNDLIEDIATKIPLRPGCLVWDIQDKSGWGAETSFGGSLLTGFVRATVQLSDEGYTEGVNVFTGDPTFPDEYYRPGFMGTNPHAPWVVLEDGPYTGIKSSEFKYYEATATSFIGGGLSMPGVNEGISAGVNMGGDFLTSLINSAIPVSADFGIGAQISIPSLGGALDAVAKILYENTFFAFNEVPSLRAAPGGQALPISGLESTPSSLGDFHLYEDWAEGAERANTISMAAAIRARIWATRARTTHKIKMSDAAPYYLGEKGYGHFWLGDRVGVKPLDFPIEDLVFVERVTRIVWEEDENGPKGWDIEIGQVEPQDPGLKVLDFVREFNSGLGTMGIL